VRTESSYKLLEENMDLLKKLTLKEDICRYVRSWWPSHHSTISVAVLRLALLISIRDFPQLEF